MSKIAAVCFSGEMRDLEETYENLKNCLFIPLDESGYSVRVYIHAWGTNELIKSAVGRVSGCPNLDVAMSMVYPDSFASNLYSPQKAVFEDYFDSPPYKARPPVDGENSGPSRQYSQMYKIEKCFGLVENAELVIRSRTDLFFDSPLNFSQIDPNTVYIPSTIDQDSFSGKGWSVDDDYCTDFFAYGDMESMRSYSCGYSEIDNLCENENFPYTFEKFLKRYLDYKGCNIQKLPQNVAMTKNHRRRNYRWSD